MTQAPLVSRTSVALVHHPVVDKAGKVITTAVTNLDIHDIARASRTFGLHRYFVITPVQAQRDLVAQIVGHWTEGSGREHNDKRTDALELVTIVHSLDDVVASLGRPFVVATAARARENCLEFKSLTEKCEADDRPLLLLFGTGWGLADEVFSRVDAVLPPIRSHLEGHEYNHLSVRSAVAIVLDRLFGNRD